MRTITQTTIPSTPHFHRGYIVHESFFGNWIENHVGWRVTSPEERSVTSLKAQINKFLTAPIVKAKVKLKRVAKK